MIKKSWPVLFIILVVLLVVAIGFAGVIGYFYWQLSEENLKLIEVKKNLEKQLTSLQNDLSATTLALQEEQARNTDFADQLDNLAGTVGTLDKLSKTDKELLQKYSKIYFLNEHYVPTNLATISPQFLYNSKQSAQIHTNVWPKLENLLQSALSSGITLQINSAYRSFGTQAAIKSGYKVTYGAGTANAFSADQGYSEHQLGTTVDFGTPSIKGDFSKFGTTKEFDWLVNNAYKYGFTMSYPKNNNYYIYEPWHWRYVGVALATKLHDENKYFYNLPQRTIDQYLVNIFD